jgi:hypothetical protein
MGDDHISDDHISDDHISDDQISDDHISDGHAILSSDVGIRDGFWSDGFVASVLKRRRNPRWRAE